jgi:hypothetical protein
LLTLSLRYLSLPSATGFKPLVHLLRNPSIRDLPDNQGSNGQEERDEESTEIYQAKGIAAARCILHFLHPATVPYRVDVGCFY